MTLLQRISLVGSWLVLAAGLLTAFAYANGWSGVIAALLGGPGIDPTEPADNFAGLALYGILAATVPFFLALWGLWHLHGLLSRYAKGETDLARRDLAITGLALMGVAASLVLAGVLLGVVMGLGTTAALMPVHLAVFALGFALLALSRRLKREVE